jgi:glycosyltransferase involved in cell wall biosynthesis
VLFLWPKNSLTYLWQRMNFNEIGIVMPVKNAAAWLTDCLDSIRAQTYTRWNLYAVDDGSTDHSLALLKTYASKDPRVRVFTNKGQGIVEALRTAYTQTTEPFITRMDADDLMPPDKLSVLYEAVSQAPNRVVTGKVRYFSENSVSEGYRRYEAWLNERVTQQDFELHMYRECVIASGNWMCHRETLDKVGAFESLYYPEDYDLVLRWYAGGVMFTGTNHVTHQWREHGLRTSRNSTHYNQDAFFRLKLSRWVALEIEKMNRIVLVGEGVKANLAKKFMQSAGIEFIQVGQEAKNNQLSMASYKPRADDKVLICVYPNAEVRQALEKLLSSKGLQPGVNWWYV